MSQTNDQLRDVTLAILAGGEGSRMGRPKGELAVGGVPILEYLLARFDWPGPTLLVTAPHREHPPGWENWDREVVDAVAGEGPLRGVLTALENAESEVVVVVTIDMPNIGTQQSSWLIEALQTQHATGVMTSRAIDGQDQVEPFPVALRRSAADTIRQCLTQGVRSVHRLPNTDAGFIVVPAPMDWELDVWTNLNSPGDFEKFSSGS